MKEDFLPFYFRKVHTHISGALYDEKIGPPECPTDLSCDLKEKFLDKKLSLIGKIRAWFENNIWLKQLLCKHNSYTVKASFLGKYKGAKIRVCNKCYKELKYGN